MLTRTKEDILSILEDRLSTAKSDYNNAAARFRNKPLKHTLLQLHED
jgi:hypothetical protein